MAGEAEFAAAAAGVAQGGLQMLGQRMANLQNERLAREQALWNYRMWEAQNEYNHPVAQMARLEEGGLNPRLVYSSGSPVGNAGDVHGYNRANVESVAKGFDAFSNFYNFRSIEAKTDNTRSDTVLKSIKAAHDGLKLDIDRETKDALISKVKSDAESAAINTEIKGTRLKEVQGVLENNIKKSAQELRKVTHDANSAAHLSTLRKLEAELNENLKPLGLTTSDPAVARMFFVALNKLGFTDAIGAFMRFFGFPLDVPEEFKWKR